MPTPPRKLAILGSTGSIGTQALEVAALHPEAFEIVALTAHANHNLLFEQVRTHRPRLAGLTLPIPPADIPQDVRFCQWVFGEDALPLAAQTDAQDVLVSVVGMAGLKGVLAALKKNKRVLLANKEALVAGGALVTQAAASAGVHALLPVDSEHSAIFQCLQGAAGNPIDRLFLTCSGGPFRTWEKQDIRAATPRQALRHPNWVMGQKITIDSATLFNKALEIIEAKWLFNVASSQIEVLIHPQSVIHSAVGFADGAVLAQLGTPDMRIPILYAMAYPHRLATGGKPFHFFTAGSLTFEPPDECRFPSLRMAREVLAVPTAAACVLNAANEVAVAKFLQVSDGNSMPLGRIYDIVEECLQKLGHLPAHTLEDILEADRRTRMLAQKLLI